MPTSSSSNPEPVTVLRGHVAEVTTARFMDGCDDDGLPHLLSGGSDGEVRLWSLRTRRPVAAPIACTFSRRGFGLH